MRPFIVLLTCIASGVLAQNATAAQQANAQSIISFFHQATYGADDVTNKCQGIQSGETVQQQDFDDLASSFLRDRELVAVNNANTTLGNGISPTSCKPINKAIIKYSNALIIQSQCIQGIACTQLVQSGSEGGVPNFDDLRFLLDYLQYLIEQFQGSYAPICPSFNSLTQPPNATNANNLAQQYLEAGQCSA